MLRRSLYSPATLDYRSPIAKVPVNFLVISHKIDNVFSGTMPPTSTFKHGYPTLEPLYERPLLTVHQTDQLVRATKEENCDRRKHLYVSIRRRRRSYRRHVSDGDVAPPLRRNTSLHL